MVLDAWREAAWRANVGVKGFGLLAKEQRSAAMARSKRCPAAKAVSWARWTVQKARVVCRMTPTGQDAAWNWFLDPGWRQWA